MQNKSKVKFLKPADFIIHYFKGLRPAARHIGSHHASINKWRAPKNKKGCDGYIPRIAMHRILDLSKKNGWKIRPYNLIVGKWVRT